MSSLNEYMLEYKNQLEKGDIKKAYRGIIKYIMDLRTHFKAKYPDYYISGSIYHGYMDMTYFSFFPASLRKRKLKIAVVFIHDTFQFEVWLVGYNKKIQKEYWKMFKEGDWDKYRIPSNIEGLDSIIESTLADNPDFNYLEELSEKIEEGTLSFIRDIEKFLSK